MTTQQNNNILESTCSAKDSSICPESRVQAIQFSKAFQPVRLHLIPAAAGWLAQAAHHASTPRKQEQAQQHTTQAGASPAARLRKQNQPDSAGFSANRTGPKITSNNKI